MTDLPGLPVGATGLPAPVEALAQRGLTTFLGGLSQYLGEWIRRRAQGVADVTDARTIITRAMAHELGAQSAADPVILAAAAEKLMPGYVRKMSNRLNVARQTVIALEAPAVGPEKSVGGENPRTFDEDWFNVFERYAEDASSEELQQLWGRIFAGELRSKGSFSRRSLRFIAELDQETAELCDRAAKRSVGDIMVSQYVMEHGRLPKELLELERLGLISGVGPTDLRMEYGHLPEGYRIFSKGGMAIRVTADNLPAFNVFPVTRLGREIFSLLDDPNCEALRHLANALKGTASIIELGTWQDIDTDLGYFGPTEILHRREI